MSPKSEEYLERIAQKRREGVHPSHRLAALAVVGAALATFVLVGAGIWWLMGSASLPAADPGTLIGRLEGWYLRQRGDALRAPLAVSQTVTFEIRSGEGLASVANRLETEGLIRDAEAFLLLARMRGLDRSVQAGTHTLSAAMQAEEVLQELQVAPAESVTLTFPEGLRAEEVAALLDGNGVADRDEFMALVTSGQSTGRAAVDERPEGASLEGYLFPDTYDFEPNAGAQAALDRLLDTFEARLTPDMRESAAASGMTLHDIVTLASIVEREAMVDAERPKIARAFLNRLDEPPYLLSADPTVQYALGFQAESGTWWKRPLSRDDTSVESPYNTYTQPGLPPGPISSPRLASIGAVVEPAEGDWQFFVANDVACDGTHVFGVTFDDHLQNIAQYQTGDCGN